MDKIFKPFKEKKKISFDLNEEFLNVIDELANLTKNSRTTIIEAVIGRGLFPYFDLLKNLWEDYLSEYKNEKIKKEIKNHLQNLEKIKSNHEWLNPDYYWENLLSNKNSDKETKKRMIKLLRHMNLMPVDKKRFKNLLNKNL